MSLQPYLHYALFINTIRVQAVFGATSDVWTISGWGIGRDLKGSDSWPV